MGRAGIVTSPNRALTRSWNSPASARKAGWLSVFSTHASAHAGARRYGLTRTQSQVKNGLHHLQHVCITFAADIAKNKNAGKAPISGTATESSCVQDDRSLFAADLENTHTHPIAEGDDCVCVRSRDLLQTK
ncbi:hypothetical protein Mpal_1496 [Methanosphaerula palustris E1-9c]|uniref:Uncharacterized protein n=1 Tax=Methanosphaerula palustris (strain ATCC BAA-1556 / DSM 19958 / E1-9c) TaxID=521011 RepID=B8GIK3_METPE|nr:hypothetical protein Mpal_1496 [Methanosphaerula palustris E1-9c]